MTDTIRIWIGTEEKTNLACKTLEHSILSRTKSKVKFFKDPGISWRTKSGAKLGVGTGFSLQRWYIPERMNYEGFCIYLDADMIVFADILEFWSNYVFLQSAGKSIACTYQKDKWFKHGPATSTMLINCEEALLWRINNQLGFEEHLKNDKDRKKYIALMHADPYYFNYLPFEIEQSWNCFNKPGTNGCKLLHYTVEPMQPWYTPSHPFKDLWRDEFISALASGYITKDEVKLELSRYSQPSSCCRGEGLHHYWRKFIQ